MHTYVLKICVFRRHHQRQRNCRPSLHENNDVTVTCCLIITTILVYRSASSYYLYSMVCHGPLALSRARLLPPTCPPDRRCIINSYHCCRSFVRLLQGPISLTKQNTWYVVCFNPFPVSVRQSPPHIQNEWQNQCNLSSSCIHAILSSSSSYYY